MTQSDHNPKTIREGLNLFDEVLGALAGSRHPTRQPEQGTRAAEDEWRAATREAGRKHCADQGHRYQVHGRHDPTKITCPTCGREWSVTS
jgi:hypothetical protein